MLKKQLLSDIESNDVSVGLEILQEIELQSEHYEYLISKLSLKKITKILMNDEFLLFLNKTFKKLMKMPMITDEDG
jgi:hypothetical protein